MQAENHRNVMTSVSRYNAMIRGGEHYCSVPFGRACVWVRWRGFGRPT